MVQSLQSNGIDIETHKIRQSSKDNVAFVCIFSSCFVILRGDFPLRRQDSAFQKLPLPPDPFDTPPSSTPTSTAPTSTTPEKLIAVIFPNGINFQQRYPEAQLLPHKFERLIVQVTYTNSKTRPFQYRAMKMFNFNGDPNQILPFDPHVARAQSLGERVLDEDKTLSDLGEIEARFGSICFDGASFIHCSSLRRFPRRRMEAKSRTLACQATETRPEPSTLQSSCSVESSRVRNQIFETLSSSFDGFPHIGATVTK